jgi:hypothetical protein
MPINECRQPGGKLIIKVLAIACLILQTIAGSAIAQAGIKRTALRSIDFPAG